MVVSWAWERMWGFAANLFVTFSIWLVPARVGHRVVKM